MLFSDLRFPIPSSVHPPLRLLSAGICDRNRPSRAFHLYDLKVQSVSVSLMVYSNSRLL